MRLRREFKIPEQRKNRLQVMSSGGGTQSNCMIVLIAKGLLPMPDIVVMADTEREASEVFEYQNDYMKPICEKIGLEYVIVKKSDWVKEDIEDGNGTILPPFFTEYNGRKPNGDTNKQPGFCSDKWKTAPIRRYLNDRYGEKVLTGSGVDFWIGMSFDEPSRIKCPAGKWQKRYPLFEAQISRTQAIKIVEDFGLPTPPRSACYMCPNRHDDEWHYLKNNSPDDFKLACDFERHLQLTHPWLWLHQKGKPLNTLDFVELSRSDKQIDIFDAYCDTGMCFV